MYQSRMMGYYPPTIQSILEFQAIINSEYPELETIKSGVENVISDAYLQTMSEERIVQWENLLGIRSIEGSSLEDRRETIIARFRGQGKLNTELINNIVKTFTGAGCKTWIEDGVLYVRLLPSSDNKEYLIENIINEIVTKVPVHLGCDVAKYWQTWENVNNAQVSWQTTKNTYGTWENVLYDEKIKVNGLDESKLNSFQLA